MSPAVASLRHLVTLENDEDVPSPVVFLPPQVYASIEPGPPSTFDEQRVSSTVTVYYHPQITFNTRIRFQGRTLFVRGIQNVNEENAYQVLLCEEVVTP